MSRPSVFRRIAAWLKNTANLNENRKKRDAMERVTRQYSVQALESREMLNADWGYDPVADRLILDNFSETVEESLFITETITEYRFVLAEGTWNGVSVAPLGVTNAGSELRVSKLPIADPFNIDHIRIDETLGMDINFGSVNFNDKSIQTFTINSSGGDIQQTLLSRVIVDGFSIDGANIVRLREINNQFGLVSITDTNDVQLRDSGALSLSDILVHNDAEFENNGLMLLTEPVTIGGNLLLNSNNGDLIQQRDAGVIVVGATYLKSNFTNEFGIDLSHGDRSGDGVNDNDFMGPVHVLQGAQIEIVDSNDLIIGDVTGHSNTIRDILQFYGEAQNGSITIDGVISIPGSDDDDGKVILRATNGGTQTAQGRILTDDLLVVGEGDFIFDKENAVLDLNAPRPGSLAADIVGNFVFNNEEDLQVSAVNFEFISERALDGTPLPAIVANVNALRVEQYPDGSKGNLIITTSDDNLTQDGSAPVVVEDLTTIDVGTGNVIWNYGDELGDLLNDNNWNRITIANANDASFIDEDAITIEDINVANNARFFADNDNSLLLDGQQVVGNNILFQSSIGLTQVSGFVDAAGLMVQGNGIFVFDLTNRLGDIATPGRVAANLDSGEFQVDNLDGLEVSTLAAFGVNLVGIDGVDLGKAALRGSEIVVTQVITAGDVLLESATTISQASAITADNLIFRSNGDTDLSVANSATVIAGEVEGDLNYNSAIEFWVGNLSYDGTTVAGLSVENGATNDFNLTAIDVDVHQFADAPVIVEGTLTIDVGLGCLGFAFGDSDPDAINDNDFNIVVVTSGARIELVDRNNLITNSINVSDQIRLQAETGTLSLEGDLVATNKVLLQAGNGVEQNPDINGVEGIINTAALMLQGDGNFILDHLNEVGDAMTKGELAVEINGGFELNNIFELVSKNLSFDLKDGSTVTINGFIINSGGDTLVLNVSGLVIETEISAPKIVINTTGDIVQGAAGRFITDALILNGVGNFELTALNQIGTAATPGMVAINVEGNVEILNEFAIDFPEIICGVDTFQGATLTPGLFSDGDLTLRTLNEDITQSDDSIFVVPGTMTFDVGTGSVNLPGFALAQNDFSVLKVDSGGVIEVSDVNGIIIEESTVSDRMKIAVGGAIPARITLDDNVFVTNELLLIAGVGVSQQRGFIVADTLMLSGAGDFDLMLDNQVNNIAAEINGNLSLSNHVDLTVVKQDYTDLDAGVTSFSGIDLVPAFFDGNLNITTSNDNFGQATDAHVKVAEAATFDLGSGELELIFGDSNTDTINDNDLNVLAIVSASTAEVVDQNSISIDNIDVNNNLFVQSEGGSISIQGQVVADNSIMLKSIGGAGTTVGALLDTDTLLIEGKGEFSLNGENRIGAAAVPGNVGIDVDGNVILNNVFGIHFDDVTYTQLDTTAHNLMGVNVDVNGFAGNLFVSADGPITDDPTINIDVDGSAGFIAGPGSDVNLGDGASTLNASSIGLAGRNVMVEVDNALVLDGVQVTGNLMAKSKGSLSQSGVDASGMAGTRFISVNGTSHFIVDSVGGGTEQLNVNLLSVGSALMNNRFGGNVIIEGTSVAAGFGELGSVQFRNAILDTATFPTINRTAGDQLTGLTVWAPNSSLTIKDLGGGTDYDVITNMSVFAGVDSVSGQLGGNLKVTDNAKTRSLRDEAGVRINVGNNLNTNAANTLILADSATDSIQVGGTLGLVNQGGANENRIRIGVATGGTRGDDSGATVNSSKIRTRANRNGTDGHITVNVDGNANFTNSNFATSLVVVAGGNITDDANASITVANSAFFEANGGANDITLGDNNATNRTIFGSVGFKGNNVLFTEDTSTILNGSDIGGNLNAFSKGTIRQSGLDRSGRAGTGALEVDGNSTFTVDGKALPTNHLSDPAGRDVLLMADSSQKLIDNRFGGSITIQSTQKLSGGLGTVRSVEIRNIATNAATPTFNVTAADKLRHLTIWHPNSSVNLSNQANATDYDVAGELTVIAGLDSSNGRVNGTKTIVNNGVLRNISDQNGVRISVGRSASFYAANNINLVNSATNSLVVNNMSTFVSKSGLLGNDIDVGTSGARGNDSGGTFTTDRLKFTIDDNGFGGDLTIVADAPFALDVSSSAPSVVLSP